MMKSNNQHIFFRVLLSFMVQSLHSETLPVVEVILNDQAYLPCNFSSLGDIDDITLVLWFKENVTQPLYSIDARNGHISEGTRFSGPVLGKRAFFMLTGDPPSLRIDPIELTDSGIYRCRIDSKNSRTMNIDMIVQVIVLPTVPKIKDKFGVTLEGTAGPYDEGAPLALVCESEGGDPHPNVTWWKDNKILDDTYRVMPGKMVKNELLISSLERSHLHDKLKCTALNNNLQAPLSSHVILDVNFRPTFVQLEKLNSLSAGKEYNISCRASGSRPKIRVNWLIDNKVVNEQEIFVNSQELSFKSYWVFRPKRSHNRKTLTCRADNPLITDSSISDEQLLHIHYKPYLSLKVNSHKQNKPIMEGSQIVIGCISDALPEPERVNFTFNGKLMQNIPNRVNITTSNLLVIGAAAPTDQGQYACVAQNSEGTSHSKAIKLKILHAPICKEPKEIVFAFQRNWEGRLDCEVHAEPQQVSFTWWLNSTEGIVRQLKSYTSQNNRSFLTLVPKTSMDYGYYFCSANNSIGAQLEPCIFRVISVVNLAGSPRQVKNCSLSSRSKDTLKVDCTVGYDGGEAQYFIMEVFNSDTGKIIANINSSAPSLQVNDIPGNTPVRLDVYAVNSKGKSPPFSLHSNTVVVNSSDSELLKAITPTVAILIGIVAGLVLVTSLVLITVKIKWHLRKTRNAKHGNDTTNKSIGEEISETHDSAENSEGKSPDIIPSNRKTVDVNIILREDNEMSKCLNHIPEGVYRAGDLVNISHRDWGPQQNLGRRNHAYQELAVIYPSYDKVDELRSRTDINEQCAVTKNDEMSNLLQGQVQTPRTPALSENELVPRSSDENILRTFNANQKSCRRGIESTV